MKIFSIVGTIILLIGIILLLVGLVSYDDYFKPTESFHQSLPLPFDYRYLITGMIIVPTGIVTLVMGLKKRI